MSDVQLTNNDLERMLSDQGFENFKWINPRDIITAQWVRNKCTFGCPDYGKGACCPPNTPSVDDCRKFFDEYNRGLVLQFSMREETPGDRHSWYETVNKKLLDLERSVFLEGAVKVFMLVFSTCSLCKECMAIKSDCKHPSRARPTPEAFAVDVFSTVRQLGFSINVLKNTEETMNRYAILLVE
ncbi:MAG: DUF2284 domain-containing protein [Candidatus Thorarchaeota archaeon]|jgi:predicted metal-binding protein